MSLMICCLMRACSGVSGMRVLCMVCGSASAYILEEKYLTADPAVIAGMRP